MADGPSATHFGVCKILLYFCLKHVSALQIQICSVLNYGKVKSHCKALTSKKEILYVFTSHPLCPCRLGPPCSV